MSVKPEWMEDEVWAVRRIADEAFDALGELRGELAGLPRYAVIRRRRLTRRVEEQAAVAYDLDRVVSAVVVRVMSGDAA